MLKKILGRFFGNPVVRRARKNQKNYDKLLKRWNLERDENFTMQRVYTDRAGNNYYTLADPLDVCKERYERIEEAIKALEYGITRDELEESLEGILSNVAGLAYEKMTMKKLRDFVEPTRNLLNDLLFRVRRIKRDEVVLDLALLMFYIDGESPFSVNDVTLKRKREIANNDDDLRAFFLLVIEDIYSLPNDTAAQDSDA